MTLTIVLTDQVPGGKTSGVREGYTKSGRKYRYPNARFVNWRQEASTKILVQRAKWDMETKMKLPLNTNLLMRISYRPMNRIKRDLTGMQDAVQHLLEYNEIVQDDACIKYCAWDMPYREDGPCMIIYLTEV